MVRMMSREVRSWAGRPRCGWLTVLMVAATGLSVVANENQPVTASAATTEAPPISAAAKSATKPVGDPPQQQRWLEGLNLLSAGQFDKAVTLINQVSTDGVRDARVQQVRDWLTGFIQNRHEQKERIRQDYDKYVGWVREDITAKRWSQAMAECGLAYNNADDQDAFRQEVWFKEAVSSATDAAKQFEADAKWFKAARIYAYVSDIFPQNSEYREALKCCQGHIRLELTYSPEADWEASVAGIEPEMAREAYFRIATEYLKEPSFKEATIAGLKQVLMLVREPKLQKVFPNLKNAELVDEFCQRVEARLQQAEKADSITVEEMVSKYFIRVVRINDEIKVVPTNVLIAEFVHGSLQPLDRFSDMLWPADVKEFEKHTQGRFSGVGIQIRKDPGELIRVISPLEDTPAYRAGIQAGDAITKINGKSTKKISISAAVREITGPAGTKVTLTFKRTGVPEEFDVELQREEITIFTIKGYERDDAGRWKYLIDPERKIGYIRMTNFTDGTIDELKEVIRKLYYEDRMRGLIFDLRGNPGGPLKAAVEVSNLFLEADRPIVSTKDRHGKDWQTASTTDEAHYADFPLIVLVNGNSASASEIVTGALQEHHRALIVGERTFGKGSVQQVLPLTQERQAYLKLTTAKYYLPNGRCLHRDEDSTTWGVDPDVKITLAPKEIYKSNELRLKWDILRGKNQKALTDEDYKQVLSTRPATEESPTTQPTTQTAEGEDEDAAEEDDEPHVVRDDPNEYPEVDPQLDTSLLLMRVRVESEQPWPVQEHKTLAAEATISTGG